MLTERGPKSTMEVSTPQPAERPAGVSVFMVNILFIDGRNFMSKISSILNPETVKDKKVDFALYDFKGLLGKVLAGITTDSKLFYLGKLTVHEETVKKSQELIEEQRLLKAHLEGQGFEVVLAGHVRGHTETCRKGHTMLTFKEKGVDVRIAVDMITRASRKEINLAIIASSDSDLQPAVRELRGLGIERIYLGFEAQPNKGLTYTTNRTILIRNSEVEEFAKASTLL